MVAEVKWKAVKIHAKTWLELHECVCFMQFIDKFKHGKMTITTTQNLSIPSYIIQENAGKWQTGYHTHIRISNEILFPIPSASRNTNCFKTWIMLFQTLDRRNCNCSKTNKKWKRFQQLVKCHLVLSCSFKIESYRRFMFNYTHPIGFVRCRFLCVVGNVENWNDH